MLRFASAQSGAAQPSLAQRQHTIIESSLAATQPTSPANDDLQGFGGAESASDLPVPDASQQLPREGGVIRARVIGDAADGDLISIPASEFQAMRRMRAKVGDCTREEAEKWGLLDIYPKRYTSWLKMEHCWEQLGDGKLGTCKFCNQDFGAVAQRGHEALIHCAAPEAAEAAKKRDEFRARNTQFRGPRK